MICTTVAEYNTDIKNNSNHQQHSLKKASKAKDKEVSNESINVKEPLLKDLSLAFSTSNNENGNISFHSSPTGLNQNDNEKNLVQSHSSSMIDLPLANGSSHSLHPNHQDANKLSYDDVRNCSGMSLSCSSIRSEEHLIHSKSSIDSENGSPLSEDESFIYNSHLSEIDRNEDIKDLRIKLKKAIKSLDKKKNDLTLAAVIGQCLLEANTNLKTLNYKLMNKRDQDGSSVGSMNSEIDPPSSLIQNHKNNVEHDYNNRTRVYTGVGRQENKHVNLIPENSSLDENTYNSVVEYHEENYNRVIKQLTDINNQLENNNLDLRRQVNDLEEVVKTTKNKYNRGIVESEKKLNEMEIKLNTMTEINNQLLKDNQDLIKEYNTSNNYKNNEIKQEQKLIDSLYNELYDMQQKIEEVNNSKEKCEKKYEKLNKEYIKSQGEIDELKKVQEQNKIIEQINTEQENRIQELHEYMEYQRDYISRLENQLFFSVFNPMNNKLLKDEKIIENDNRIVELIDEEEKKHESDINSVNGKSIKDEEEKKYESDINSVNGKSIKDLTNTEDSIQEHDDRNGNSIVFSNNRNNENENHYQNSQLVLYSPNQILNNVADNTHDNNTIQSDSNTNSKKEIINNNINIDEINTALINSKRRFSLNGNRLNLPETKSNTKKRISIGCDGILSKQSIYYDSNDENDIKKRRRASIPNSDRSYINERQRRKSLNVVPNNQFIYSYGNPMFSNNKLLKNSDDSSDSSSSDQNESLDKFQHDIKKIFKPRPPVKKMKMNKQEKKMIKKVKMDKLNDIIQHSESSSYTGSSSSYLNAFKSNSNQSLAPYSNKNSLMNIDSKESVTSHDCSDVKTIPSSQKDKAIHSIHGNTDKNNSSTKHDNNSSKNSYRITQNHDDVKATNVNSLNSIENNTSSKVISLYPNMYKVYKPTSPLVINNKLESSTSESSFLKNEKEHPYYRKSNHPNTTKPQKKTFKSIFLRNPFSSNFSSSKSHLTSSSISSWTNSSTTLDTSPNKNHLHQNEGSSSHNLKSSTSTMDISLYVPESEFSTQIIVKNDSEIIDTPLLSDNNDIKTSELLWNKENGVGKEQLLRDPINKDILSSDSSLVHSNSNSSVSEESHKNRNKVAKMLIKGWIHVVDGISLFNPYHNNYRLESYSYEHGSNKDNNPSKDQEDINNNKAMIPFDPDQHRLSTTHFFNDHY